MMNLVIPINGVLKRYDECATEAEREYWLVIYDKIIEEARDVQEELYDGTDE